MLATKPIQTKYTKYRHFASWFISKWPWKDFESSSLSQQNPFQVVKKTFTSGLPMNKPICKWLTSAFQLDNKHFTSGLFASELE